jgi:hypothetical protein
MPKLNLELAFFADYFEPNELTKLIGIQPTGFWFKGDELPSLNEDFWAKTDKPKPTRKETCWEYETGYVETYEIDDLSKPLLDIFEPHTESIVKFMKANNLKSKLSVVAVWDFVESTPALGASKRLIKFLSKIDGWIDEDLYVNNGNISDLGL